MYYWFKSGEIHNAVSAAGGLVLHKTYLKYYKSNQLAEQGSFNYGLKTGYWKTWYNNGQLKTLETWINGYKQGACKAYDSLGHIVKEGAYRNNKKSGYWVDHVKHDTLFYKKDAALSKRPKNLLNRLFDKKNPKAKKQIKQDKKVKRKQDSIARFKLKLNRQIKKRKDSIARAKKRVLKAIQDKTSKK